MSGRSNTNYGVHGSTSLTGGTGVGGAAPANRTGVFGFAGEGLPDPPAVAAGVYGRAVGGPGVRGDSAFAGVSGYSGPALDAVPEASAKTGVYGYANQDANAIGVHGRSPQGRGVFGHSSGGTGILGQSDTGIGLRGISASNTGLRGDSTTGTAVRAFSTGGRAINATAGGTSAPAIASQSTGGTAAVFGFSGAGSAPAALTQTGVHGRCDQSDEANGVAGTSASGTGVYGDSTNGVGVVGSGFIGVLGFGDAGVVGDVDGGTGVMGWSGVAIAPDPAAQVGVWAGAENGRTALQVAGVARFNRSGRTTLSAGQSSKKITVPGGISSTAFGLATLQSNRSGVWVRAVVPASADGSITIYLNAAVTASTSLGWMVIG